MVDQGDAQPKGPCQRELVNLGCLLPYQNHQWNVKMQTQRRRRMQDTEKLKQCTE
jgi:hypothetical protein